MQDSGLWMRPSWCMFAWKNNLEVSSWLFFLSSLSSRRFVVSRGKKKGKTIRSWMWNHKTFLKSVYFSVKFVFLPIGAKVLSSTGLCWQLGAVEKMALYGRSLLIGEEQTQVEWESDSHIILGVAHVIAAGPVWWERGLGGQWGQYVVHLTGKRAFQTSGQKWWLPVPEYLQVSTASLHVHHLLLTTNLWSCHYSYYVTNGETEAKEHQQRSHNK